MWLEEIAFGFQGGRVFTSVNNQKVSPEMNWMSWMLELCLSINIYLAVCIRSHATETVLTVTVPYLSCASSSAQYF